MVYCFVVLSCALTKTYSLLLPGTNDATLLVKTLLPATSVDTVQLLLGSISTMLEKVTVPTVLATSSAYSVSLIFVSVLNPA